MYDPFGYYTSKNIYAIEKNENLPFFEDYPVNDSQWFIGENYVFATLSPESQAIPDAAERYMEDLSNADKKDGVVLEVADEADESYEKEDQAEQSAPSNVVKS